MKIERCVMLLVCTLLGAGCGKSEEARDTRRVATPYELVSVWAGAQNEVRPYTDVQVPGFELFWVTTMESYGPSGGFCVAVPLDERNFLEGKGALRALLARGAEDPLDAARLTLVFLERGGEPLVGARTDIHRQFGVTPPRREANVLSFWYERDSRDYVELLRAELELDTLEYRTRSFHVEEVLEPSPHALPPDGPRPVPRNHP